MVLPAEPGPEPQRPERTFIEESKQRDGDAAAGFDYLVNGGYVSSGIPFSLYKTIFGDDNQNVLGRTGDNATLPPEFTAVTHANGQKIVSPNCMNCHADRINGELIVGLGNTTFDYSSDLTSLNTAIDFAVTTSFGNPSSEWDAYQQFSQASAKINANIQTEVRGVNPADQLTAVLVAHRDPESLEWIEEPQLDIPETTVPTDVPAWWLLKKKNAMFYSGIGRGDFSKFLMASSLLTLKDTTEARVIDDNFVDVLAWINSLEAPQYPENIDDKLADEGKILFDRTCAGCHGKYDGSSEYPNLLISLEEVGTDATLLDAYTSSTFGNFVDWYNSSWFAQGNNGGKLVVEPGYIAPPLDGVWATAPYLHNGSVPDLETLLDSGQRPEFWQRNFNGVYDMKKVGWTYQEVESKLDSETYDTNLQGYSNSGHTFGDGFTTEERSAVIEYLKTL